MSVVDLHSGILPSSVDAAHSSVTTSSHLDPCPGLSPGYAIFCLFHSCVRLLPFLLSFFFFFNEPIRTSFIASLQFSTNLLNSLTFREIFQVLLSYLVPAPGFNVLGLWKFLLLFFLKGCFLDIFLVKKLMTVSPVRNRWQLIYF